MSMRAFLFAGLGLMVSMIITSYLVLSDMRHLRAQNAGRNGTATQRQQGPVGATTPLPAQGTNPNQPAVAVDPNAAGQQQQGTGAATGQQPVDTTSQQQAAPAAGGQQATDPTAIGGGQQQQGTGATTGGQAGTGYGTPAPGY